MKLHFGCNDILMPGYIGVDLVAPHWAKPGNFVRVDLSNGTVLDVSPPNYNALGAAAIESEVAGLIDLNQDYPKWPWKDSSVDEIVAHDVFEHIQNEDYKGSAGIIYCLNEAHRILKPGGILDLKVPCIDFDEGGRMRGSMGVFCDPTHCQVWTADTRYYFEDYWNNPRGERGRLGPGMGITAVFKTVGGESFGLKNVDGKIEPNWTPVYYAKGHPERSKLILKLKAVKS